MPFVIERKKRQRSNRVVVHDNGTCRVVVEGPEHSSADLSYPLYCRVFLEVIDGYDAMDEPRWTRLLAGNVNIAQDRTTRVFVGFGGPAFHGEAGSVKALQGFLDEIVEAYLDSLDNCGVEEGAGQ